MSPTNKKDTPAGKLCDWLNKLGIDVWRGQFGVGAQVDWNAIAEKLEAATARCREHAGEGLPAEASAEADEPPPARRSGAMAPREGGSAVSGEPSSTQHSAPGTSP